MGTSPLTVSQVLVGLGYFCAFGTIEPDGIKAELGLENIVGLRDPFYTAHNNGVRVFYDELGRPWVAAVEGRESIQDDITAVRRAVPDGQLLREGCYVPHSNDGGFFMMRVLPALNEHQKPHVVCRT